MRDIIWLMMKKLAKVGKKKESLTIEIFIYLFQVARKKLIKIMFFNDSETFIGNVFFFKNKFDT